MIAVANQVGEVGMTAGKLFELERLPNQPQQAQVITQITIKRGKIQLLAGSQCNTVFVRAHLCRVVDGFYDLSDFLKVRFELRVVAWIVLLEHRGTDPRSHTKKHET